jgi:hypothetical protein
MVNRKLGTCPITDKTDYYVPGNWGTECIDCDECPHRCPESKNPSGYENDKGRYHGGVVFPKNGFKIFE